MHTHHTHTHTHTHTLHAPHKPHTTHIHTCHTHTTHTLHAHTHYMHQHLSSPLPQNDIWQAQTWASLEYGGRWKLLHYGVKRAYSTYLISAYQLDSNISVYLVSDNYKDNLKVDLAIAVIGWDVSASMGWGRGGGVGGAVRYVTYVCTSERV